MPSRKGTYDEVMDRRLTRLERRLGNVQAGIEKLHALVRRFGSSSRPALKLVKGGDDG